MFHQFTDYETGEKYGSFETFHVPGGPTGRIEFEGLEPGWYWWPCWPGCLADADLPTGPFETEAAAERDARQENS